ncbi:hypothetical protein, partial [Phenylobacterium sp.]|uniref:hypothetical protein n=1 Tax=Phenylobacterium sp. TaxID=1871053 RepID=UPI0025D5141C
MPEGTDHQVCLETAKQPRTIAKPDGGGKAASRRLQAARLGPGAIRPTWGAMHVVHFEAPAPGGRKPQPSPRPGEPGYRPPSEPIVNAPWPVVV